MKNLNLTLNRLALLCAVLAFGLFACNNDDDDDGNIPPAAEVVPNFLPLQTGNYWIYDVVRVDTSGEETMMGYSDTLRVIGDTLHNGNTYYIVEQDRWLTTTAIKDTAIWRDSSGYLVSINGRVNFSADDYNTIFYTWEIPAVQMQVDYFMDDSLYMYEVPAGNFSCLNYVGRVQYLDPTSNFSDRFFYTAYSNNIGMIYQNEFYASSIAFEFQRRLREYHLE